MTIAYRRATADEMIDVAWTVSVGFGGSTAEDRLRQGVERTQIKPEWRICAYDGAQPVAQVVVVPTTMHWNGKLIPSTGVTDVVTLPTHRRQGILRELMTRAYADMRDAGQAVTILEASMAAIYQRFGWAVVYTGHRYDFDPRHLRFIDEIPTPGRLRMIKREDARPVLEPVYRQYAPYRTLPFERTEFEWTAALALRDTENPPVLVAVYEEEGEALGYVIYRVNRHGEDRPGPDQRIMVFELVWLNPRAHRALINYLAGYDLVDSVMIWGMPADDPLFQQVHEPRLLNTRAYDGALARIVDVEKALAARGYNGSGTLVVGLGDKYAPWNTGSWALEVEGGEARAKRTDAEVQLRMTPRVLCLLLSATHSASTLAHMGLIDVSDPCALETADALFRTNRVAYCLDHWM
jgi:predicted acetyltransferase